MDFKMEVETDIEIEVEMKVEMDAPILQSNYAGRRAPLYT